jgi:crossover junction endodeoxyribonuclease RusA
MRIRKPNFEFEIPGEPVPKGRPRVTTKGYTYTPKRTQDAEELVQTYFRAKYPGAVSSLYQEYELALVFFRKSRRKTDLDNLAKLVMDSLNTLVWEDDAQITKLNAQSVRITKDPKTQVQIYVRPSARSK